MFRTPPSSAAPAAGPTSSLQVLVATPAAALAVGVGLLYLFWALGGEAGLPPAQRGETDLGGALVFGAYGLLAVAGGLGTLALVRRWWPRTPPWVPLTLVWLGAGSTFAWGLWSVLSELGGTALHGSGAIAGTEVVELAGTARLLAGTLLGTVAAFAFAERHAVRPQATPPADGRAPAGTRT